MSNVVSILPYLARRQRRTALQFRYDAAPCVLLCVACRCYLWAGAPAWLWNARTGELQGACRECFTAQPTADALNEART